MATALKRSPDLFRAAITGGVAAAIANTIAFFAAVAMSGDLMVALPGSQEPSAIPVFMAPVASLLAGFGAFGLARVLSGRANPARSFVIIATVVFALFLVGPLGKQADTGTIVWLELMHVFAFAAIVPMMMRSLRSAQI